ncbi:phosphate/phosphite/phosphonate ABC transporter substrate-binding protein [Paenalkalicoccus suaedae]|uniref:Phosphate/phosphite/phosphonate ABC transporter substrate-binding protein n=1 Tax=Paenalkalicoccus suaedae TaxID=2592382 RepID=A0A859FEN9_9BACI|nr:phosphate/phosphite/phosphonate ABC transporter substrate-binding protein [Paenalkalicoccus suaedae]QKS71639.1 phosphate/phosphite/phosphonate ABC transporter substrate-binding protein [Paenalkalicoccus suaedae]
MKKSLLLTTLASGALLLAACGDNEGNTTNLANTTNEETTTNADANEATNDSTGDTQLAGDPDVYEVAVIPSQSIGEMQTGLDLLEEHLAESLDMEVEVTHYPSYNAVVEALNYSQIDLAYFGPVTYLIAYEQSGAEAIITQEIDGSPYYYSYMITQPDAPYDSLDDLLENVGEVDFAFGSQSSTSGFAVPGYELLQRGVYENEGSYDFNSVRFTGSHDITANAVANGDVDAGAIDSAIFNALIADGMINEDDYKIIWESDQIYQYPWAVPNGTDEALIEQVQAAFMEIEEPEILSIFGGASAFVEASSDEYESILEAARAFGLLDPEPEEEDEAEEESNANDSNE